jgi:serine/threonine protein kinase
MILLELVPGLSMNKLSPSGFKQTERQEMMKAVVDADRAVYLHKVINRDLDPRNVLFPLDSSDRGCRAVIVDFGISFINPYVNDKTYLTGLADPPKYFHTLDTYNFFERIDWDWDAWINEVYADIKGSSITDREECVLRDCQGQKAQSVNDGIGQKYMSRTKRRKGVERKLGTAGKGRFSWECCRVGWRAEMPFS